MDALGACGGERGRGVVGCDGEQRGRLEGVALSCSGHLFEFLFKSVSIFYELVDIALASGEGAFESGVGGEALGLGVDGETVGGALELFDLSGHSV